MLPAPGHQSGTLKTAPAPRSSSDIGPSCLIQVLMNRRWRRFVRARTLRSMLRRAGLMRIGGFRVLMFRRKSLVLLIRSRARRRIRSPSTTLTTQGMMVRADSSGGEIAGIVVSSVARVGLLAAAYAWYKKYQQKKWIRLHEIVGAECQVGGWGLY